jgi:ABC-type sulfate transport system permease component
MRNEEYLKAWLAKKIVSVSVSLVLVLVLALVWKSVNKEFERIWKSVNNLKEC